MSLQDTLDAYGGEDRTMVEFSKDPDIDEPVLGEVTIVVRADDEAALVDIGWDSTGVYADVRTFVGDDEVEPDVGVIFNTVSVRPGRERT